MFQYTFALYSECELNNILLEWKVRNWVLLEESDHTSETVVVKEVSFIFERKLMDSNFKYSRTFEPVSSLCSSSERLQRAEIT